MEEEQEIEWFADVPISRPILNPEKEVLSFQGFSWSPDLGIIPEMGDEGRQARISLKKISQDG